MKFRKRKVCCSKCGSKMELKSNITKLFEYQGKLVQVPDITALYCPKCGNLMFKWEESMRIAEYVRQVVGEASDNEEN